MSKDGLKCPHCRFTADEERFGYAICDECDETQYHYAQEIYKAGYALVSCPKCHNVFIQKLEVENERQI